MMVRNQFGASAIVAKSNLIYYVKNGLMSTFLRGLDTYVRIGMDRTAQA